MAYRRSSVPRCSIWALLNGLRIGFAAEDFEAPMLASREKRRAAAGRWSLPRSSRPSGPRPLPLESGREQGLNPDNACRVAGVLPRAGVVCRSTSWRGDILGENQAPAAIRLASAPIHRSARSSRRNRRAWRATRSLSAHWVHGRSSWLASCVPRWL